jgi:hypothetical protein
MSDSPVPVVFIEAGNDEGPIPHPPPDRKSTSVSVSGLHFTPGSTVEIKLNFGPQMYRTVKPEGNFDWTIEVVPHLHCNMPVSATVSSSDGIEATAAGTVFCPPIL